MKNKLLLVFNMQNDYKDSGYFTDVDVKSLLKTIEKLRSTYDIVFIRETNETGFCEQSSYGWTLIQELWDLREGLITDNLCNLDDYINKSDYSFIKALGVNIDPRYSSYKSKFDLL